MITAMKHPRWFVALLLFPILIYLPTQVVHATDSPADLYVGQIRVLEDPTVTATVDQILAQNDRFTDLLTTSPNFGFTSSAYWLRIPVQNQHPEPTTFFLDIKNPLLDYVTLYLIRDDTVLATSQSGAQIAGKQRPYIATTHVLPFQLAANEAAELYVRVYSKGMPIFLPFEVMTKTELQTAVISGWVLNSAILGIVGAMLLYYAFIFSLLRSKLYLFYVLQLLFGWLIVAATGGLGSAYIYPENPWFGSDAVPFWTGGSFMLMILFTREFLGLQTYRRLEHWSYFLIVWALLLSVGSFLWPVRFSYQIISMMAFIYPAFCLVAGVTAWRHGYTGARFLIIGQMSSWCAVLLISLMSFDLFSYHPLIYQSPALSAVSDALLLSFALAERIRILQRSRIAAEEMARRNLEIRSDELERLVAERTAEIKTLQGILPICANCKKIRDDDGAWQQLETYISQHTDSEFSHGICVDCMQELYPEFYRKRHANSPSN